MLFRETFCNGKVSLSRFHRDTTGKITQTKRIGLKAKMTSGSTFSWVRVWQGWLDEAERW